VTSKAAALAYSLALNHPFVDGNKRVAHAAMEVFLALNGLSFTRAWTRRKRFSSILRPVGRVAPNWESGLSNTPRAEIADAAV